MEHEIITLCGDNCVFCPRYNAHSESELKAAAELWYKVGWRDSIVSNEEIKCSGCASHKHCTYGLTECTKAHGVSKCSQCPMFPCERISEMLERSEEYRWKCRAVCSADEFEKLEKAFFNKENNLKK